MYRLIAYFN